MTKRQANKLSARIRWDRQPLKLRECSCGHCPDCKMRQTPEERLRQHLAEVGAMTSSPITSTLSSLVHNREMCMPHKLQDRKLADVPTYLDDILADMCGQ